MFAKDGEKSYSDSYLGIFLVCTKCTPVADVLKHSPPLLLLIDYPNINDDSILALKQYHRVRRVRLQMPVTSLQKLIVAMDDEYPILEYLIIIHPVKDDSSISRFPETLQAPHLRHLLLEGFAPSDGILIAHDRCGPRHTLYFHGPLIYLLPSKYSAPMAFFLTQAGDAHS